VRLGERALIPECADRETRLIDPRRVRDDAVEVFRVALCFQQALAAAVRA
jgi:hypothetical protein